MSKLITLARLEADSCPKVRESWTDTRRVISELRRRFEIIADDDGFDGLPTPQGDPAILKKHGVADDYGYAGCIGMRPRHERCAGVDAHQFFKWWPEWAMNALTHPEAEHSVHLRITKVDPAHVRIGKYQAVYEACREQDTILIPLAGSLHDGVDLIHFYLPEKFNDWHLFDRVPAARGDDDAIRF